MMSESRAWIDLLEDEDLAFLKRFVLASGSLKDLAQAYGISYPTVRLRLDRLIAKIEVYDSTRRMSTFEKLARGMHAEGKFDLPTLKAILKAFEKEKDHGPHSGEPPASSGGR